MPALINVDPKKLEVAIPRSFVGFLKPARYKAFYGGRGSAKSHSAAMALVILATRKKLRILCCREIQKSIAESVKKLLEDKIDLLGKVYPQLKGFFTSTLTGIIGNNGSEFIFAGLRTNPTSIKSMEGIDIVWVEEASTVSQNSINILIPTIRAKGSEIWFTWNPNKPTDPVDVMFRGKGGPPPKSIVRKVNHDANPYFPEELRAEMEWDKKRDPDKYAFIWLGEYQRNSEARVFHNWRIDTLVMPGGLRPYYGADWGYSIDPSVLIRCYLLPDRVLYVDAEAYKIGCEIDHLPKLFDPLMLGKRSWPMIGDSARPETISYMNRQGFAIRAAKKGPSSVEDGIEFLKNYNIVVHPRCRHTIDELTLYSFKVDKQTDEVLPELEDKNNHVIDGLRYALEGTRRAMTTGVVATVGMY